MAEEVDPRDEADAQIARALQIVCDADCVEQCDDTPCMHERREYTEAELDTLFFSLSMAIVQLKKVPGGVAAHERAIDRATTELHRRGRQDLLASPEKAKS